MPRIRSVHPELCTDDALAGVSAEAERTFVRLWTHLDDDGRTIDSPKLLASLLYPLHDDVTSDDVDRDLDELASAGLVVRYTVTGRRYLSAKPASWSKWQKPRWYYPSKLPAPDGGKCHETPETSDVRPTNNRRTSDDRRKELRGVELRGVGAAASTSDVRPTDDERRRRLLSEAVDILTERHLAANPSKSNPKRHASAVRRGKLTDHQADAMKHLADQPDLTAAQLADLLEPRTAPRPEPPAPRLPRYGATEACPTCDGNRMIVVDGAARPCPECNPAASA